MLGADAPMPVAALVRSVGRPGRSTLPFSCPFDATKSGKPQQAAAQSEARKSADFARDEAGSGNVQHAAAKGGYRFFFRLSRNRSKSLGDFGCDELQTELRGPLLEQVHLLFAMSFLVVVEALVDIRVSPLEQAID